MNQPNILYVLTDQHRGQAMAHAGDPNLATPVMDRMAAEGTAFSAARANCPLCTPSRGSIFSGRQAHAGPVAGFFDVYKPMAPSTATELAKLGYRSAYFGKWHLGSIRDQEPPSIRNESNLAEHRFLRTPERFRAGFEDWFAFENSLTHQDGKYYRGHDIDPTPYEGYQPDALTDLFLEYLEARRDDDQPTFAVLSLHPPHFPLTVPEKWCRHDPDALEVRPNFSEFEGRQFTSTPRGSNRESLALYYAMIENLDWNLGRVLEFVEQSPRFRDNTIVVYFSDHGEFLGSHGRVERKELPHEESVRVPALFWGPGVIPACDACDAPFSLIDMMPTTLGLAGAAAPRWVQGTDFSPLLRHETFTPPKDVVLEMVSSPRWTMDYPEWRAIVTGQHKYVFFENGDELLFDLANDPYEMENLAERDDLKQPLRERLLARLREQLDPIFPWLMEDGSLPKVVGEERDVGVIDMTGPRKL